VYVYAERVLGAAMMRECLENTPESGRPYVPLVFRRPFHVNKKVKRENKTSYYLWL